MNRGTRAQLANETVELVTRGWYLAADGRRVDIAAHVSDCLKETRLYKAADLDGLQAATARAAEAIVLDVANETTLSAARRIVTERRDGKTLCLNFASAKSPGGGFLSGSQAQEESLARSSALYASLLTQFEYYETNRDCGTALYTDHMILSPNVPVFRDDDGTLLSRPYVLSMLTCPAANAGAVRKNEPEKAPLIRATMAKRIANVLAVAAHHGYTDLILGAWGCGVFGNDPGEVAELFASALLDDERFQNCFASATFAVLDASEDQRIIGPFRQRFARDRTAR